MKLPLFLKKYFWDIDFDNLNFKKREEFVILRILEYGDIKSTQWLFKNINKKRIKETILNQRVLSPKTTNFWCLFFNLKKEKILCLKKPYQKMQKSHWTY